MFSSTPPSPPLLTPEIQFFFLNFLNRVGTCQLSDVLTCHFLPRLLRPVCDNGVHRPGSDSQVWHHQQLLCGTPTRLSGWSPRVKRWVFCRFCAVMSCGRFNYKVETQLHNLLYDTSLRRNVSICMSLKYRAGLGPKLSHKSHTGVEGIDFSGWAAAFTLGSQYIKTSVSGPVLQFSSSSTSWKSLAGVLLQLADLQVL